MKLPKHIGIASITVEGGVLALREIVHASELILGRDCHPEISLHSHSFSKFTSVSAGRDWAALMIESSRRLQASGAEFFVCPANTNHIVYDEVQNETAIPWLHIAQIVAEHADNLGCKRTLLLGTKTLMGANIYNRFFDSKKIAIETPSIDEQTELNRFIYDELVRGIVTSASTTFISRLIDKYTTTLGCDSAVLGCTELPLVAAGLKCGCHVLDSTRLVAHGAIAFSLGKSITELEQLITNQGNASLAASAS